MAEQYVNNALTTLNGAITNSATTLVVTSASRFPVSGNFRIIIDSEILLVTAVSGTTFTVTRGIESTTAGSHLSGANVTHILTEAALTNIVNEKIAAAVVTPALTYATALCSADTNFVSGSWTDITGCSLSLSAGTWLITANIQFRNNGGATSTGACKLYYGSTDLVASEDSLDGVRNATKTLMTIAVLSGSQTVKLAGRNQGVPVFQALRYGDVNTGAASISGTSMTAVKIAP